MTPRRQSADHKPAWWDDSNDRAMLICRISDRKQKDGVSLGAQRHKQEAYAKSVGLRVVAVESFQESAKTSQLRTVFHAAIQRARRDRIRHLVFYAYDRVARNFTDAEMLEDLIHQGEVTLHIAQGGNVLHRDGDDSEAFLFDISIASAKHENRGRRRKTIDGMEQRCRNGWYPSRLPAFYWSQPAVDDEGHPKKRGATVGGPTEEGRRLLNRQAQLRIGGASLGLIRQTCLDEGLVPMKLIPRYHVSLVEKTLKNSFYAAIPRPHADSN